MAMAFGCSQYPRDFVWLAIGNFITSYKEQMQLQLTAD
jgi:hypothetical protein